jgi:hypothetical protein
MKCAKCANPQSVSSQLSTLARRAALCRYGRPFFAKYFQCERVAFNGYANRAMRERIVLKLAIPAKRHVH